MQRASAPPTKEAEPEKTKGKAEPKETGDKAETEEKTIKPFDPPYQGLPPSARGPRTPFATPKDLQRAMSSRLRQERATRPRPRSQSGNRKTAPRATLNLVLR